MKRDYLSKVNVLAFPNLSIFSKFSYLCFSHNYMWTVAPGQPSSISDDAEVVTLIGSSQDAANQINQKEIRWGVS